jgi:hypothetical protein
LIWREPACAWMHPAFIPSGCNGRLYSLHPSVFFVSVGLKYGPARLALEEVAVSLDLIEKPCLEVTDLRNLLQGAAARLHGRTMDKWVGALTISAGDEDTYWP